MLSPRGSSLLLLCVLANVSAGVNQTGCLLAFDLSNNPSQPPSVHVCDTELRVCSVV